MNTKQNWEGELLTVQPRIRLTRSFDQRSHSYLGYVLHVRGKLNDKACSFKVAIGKVAHEKRQLQTGDHVSGQGVPVADERKEAADLYKVSKLKVLGRANRQAKEPPPFLGVPPALDVYRQRGHRRLDARTFSSSCTACIWACEMPVEMIIDQWNPSEKKFRRETFCYGPKSCSNYKTGPTRKVPGRKGMTWEEKDWVDEEATSHRGLDD